MDSHGVIGGHCAAKEKRMAETDNPWKSALDGLFPLAMAFFLPEDAGKVSCQRGQESLETELRPMLRPVSER